MKRNYIILFIIFNINIINAQQWTTYDTLNSGLAGQSVYAIAIDAHGNKWFGTVDPWNVNKGGVSMFDGTNWTNYTVSNNLGSNFVRAIAIDSNGNKWVGMWGGWGNGIGGVSMFNDTNWITYTTSNSGLINNNVWAIAIDNHGNKWFGTSGGISKFDGINWTNYDLSNFGFINKIVQAIAIDTLGNKWFGTNYHGVLMFNDSIWINYTTLDGLACNDVFAIAIDAQNNKWFGTSSYGASKFDGVNWTTYINTDVYAISVDMQGNIWFGTGGSGGAGGVRMFDGLNWTYYTTMNGLADSLVYSLAIDSKCYKYFGTCYGGVSELSYNILNVDAGSPQNICLGQGVTLTATGGGTYQWYGGPATAIYSVTPPVTITYFVTVTNNECSAYDSVTITVNPLPNAYISHDTTVCNTIVDTLTAYGGITYLWSYNNQTTQSIIVNPLSTSTYYVTVTDTNGCVNIDDATITVDSIPPFLILLDTNNSGLICSNIFNSYQWYLNGNIIGGATSQAYSPTQSGVYTVMITDSLGCSATSAPYEYLYVGISGFENTNMFSVFPNPTTNIISIETSQFSGESFLQIFNINGQELTNKKFKGNKATLNISGLQSGIYFVKLINDKGVEVRRFVKE